MDNILGLGKSPKSPGRRRSLFANAGEKSLASPQILFMSPSSKSSLGSPKSTNTKKTKKQLPAKFRQEMPRGSLPAETSEVVKLSPIKKSTFYGNYQPKFLRATTPAQSDDISGLFKDEVKLETPPKRARLEIGKPRSAPQKLTKKKSLLTGFGINKGVSHAIKKPKPAPIQPKKEAKQSNSSSSEEEEKVPIKVAPIVKYKPSEFDQTNANSSGKIAMTKHTSVSYEIKNGLPVFRLRRSPRKKPTTAIVATKAEKQAPQSPVIGANPPTPKVLSPVKFYGENEDCDQDEAHNFSSIIDSLDDSRNMSQNDYAFFVTDDEMKQSHDEEPHSLEEIGVISDQPSRFKVDTADEIKRILDCLQPPTENEIKENRSTPNISTSATNCTKKLFPVFEQSTRRPLSSRENLPMITGQGKKFHKDADQPVIDAGQKNLDPISCLECGFVYNPGNAEDEKAHDVHHANMTGTSIKFNGWKNEAVVVNESDGRIVMIRPNDPKSHWEKAESVLEVVDRQLGINTADGLAPIRNKDESKVYLFVSDKRVVGFLLAEVLQSIDCISRASWDENLQSWLISVLPDRSKVLVGISRIWVAPDCRRMEIASRLVKAMEISFFEHKFLVKGVEYAFSHTTQDGSMFASKYVNNPDKSFLTYTPVL